MRRIKAHRLTSSVYGGLESVLRNLVDPVVEMLGDEPSTRRPAQELANKWFKRIPAAIAEVNERMGPANVTMEDVRARGLSNVIGNLDSIDRMIATAEARHNNILREIERHRTTFAAALRKTVNLEESEYKTLDAPRNSRSAA